MWEGSNCRDMLDRDWGTNVVERRVMRMKESFSGGDLLVVTNTVYNLAKAD